MEISVLGTFIAGLLTFFSPCVLPMVPILAANYMMADNESRYARLIATILFSAGFLFSFTLMGLSLPFVSDFLGGAKVYLLAISGILILLYGLKMSGLALKNTDNSKFFGWMTRSAYLPKVESLFPKRMHGLVFGATFGLAWTPCVGPILGGVLAYVATEDRSVYQSIFLMLSFGLGVVAPFIALALGGEIVSSKLKSLRKYLPKIEEATGLGLIVVGVFILTQSNLPSIFQKDAPQWETSFVDGSGKQTNLKSVAVGAHKLLFFHSTHCPVCEAMESYLPKLESECNSDLFQVVRVNVDFRENRSLVDQFQIRAVPTIKLLSKDGVELAHSVGYQSETKLRQGIGLFPKVQCALRSHPVQKEQFEDGQKCGSEEGVYTCS